MGESLIGGNNMSEGKKKHIGLWPTVSKAGNTYLAGKDKESGLKYWVFKDNKKAGVRNVRTTTIGDNESPFTDAGSLDQRTSEKDGVESIFYVADGMLLGNNKFYFNEDGTTELRNKAGEAVIGYDGEPCNNPTHNLVIG